MIRVLIVEDDPMVAELNRHYLKQMEGFQLAGIVGNGEEALNFLRGNDVELILLDVFMPNVDGMEFLRQIRLAGHKVDIIMVTAARNSSHIENALRYGVVDYVVKPFDYERLRTALIAYRERICLLGESDSLNQQEIDRGIFIKPVVTSLEVPKGLEREMLQIIDEKLRTTADFVTIEELSRQVGLSRVSLRKYLHYLEDVGKIEVKLTYRPVGRPVKMFRYISK